MNEILYSMCPEGRDGDISFFAIDGHCTQYLITAESIPGKKYKIHSFEIIPI